jgi:hypothetical protein
MWLCFSLFGKAPAAFGIGHYFDAEQLDGFALEIP